MKEAPFIKPEQQVLEFSLKGILLAIVLTAVLAMSNAYLALKIGMLTSASIPAAVISMAFLRWFKQTSVLENNLVQTAASAGEAVAGGIVYTIPALIVINYWHGFPYWENVLIALLGGTLGVLFSIPLRRVLVRQSSLPFPEGKAIAEILKASQTGSMRELLVGGVLGALIELCQTGLKVVANHYQVWVGFRRLLVGFGVGFSATLVGAGYLIGFELGLSIFVGAITGWVIAMPIFSYFNPEYLVYYYPQEAVANLWSTKVRYLGIGAMLFAGLWSFFQMLKPLTISIRQSWAALDKETRTQHRVLRTERDIPLLYLLLIASAVSAILFVFLQAVFPLSSLGLNYTLAPTIVFIAVVYIFVVGFIFSVITAYFSGMVGVSASPGSSVIIAGMLLVGWLLTLGFHYMGGTILTAHQIKAAEAITIIMGAVVTGIAAIANDNIQDLKVGHLLGATPWKQQLMLLLGVLVASLVIPLIMQILFEVYGIAGVMPHAAMDPAHSLPAPPAALMAAITQAIFHHGLPWKILFSGAGLILLFMAFSRWVASRWAIQMSALGFSIGIYLPMTSSIPLFVGGMISLVVKHYLRQANVNSQMQIKKLHKGLLLACGLVAGAALMDVLLAIPFSMARSSDILQLDFLTWEGSSLGFAILIMVGLARLFYRTVCD